MMGEWGDCRPAAQVALNWLTLRPCILACALDPGDGGDAGVATCLAACDAQYPQGKAKYDAAIGCGDTKCAAECQ